MKPGHAMLRWLATERALADECLSALDRDVMTAILKHMDEDSGEAFPSMETIARAARVHRTTAVISVRKICERGHLDERKGKGRRSNTYLLPARSGSPRTTTTHRSGSAGTTTTHRSGSQGFAVVVGDKARSGSSGTTRTLEEEHKKKNTAHASARGVSLPRWQGKKKERYYNV